MNTSMDKPRLTLTTKTLTRLAPVAVLGDEAELRTAFESGSPVTLEGKLAGEVVYLGHTRQTYDDGITTETIGLDRVLGESPKYPGHVIAAYLVDMTRLEGAPTLAALKAKEDAERAANALAVDARVAADDARLERPSEDGA